MADRQRSRVPMGLCRPADQSRGQRDRSAVHPGEDSPNRASPAVAETLVPTGYPLGTKRMCLDTGYYATFNRSNVTLVDVKKSPIEEILPNGLRTRDASYEVDRIVFAIRFDAITGALDNIDIRGIDGISLKQRWAGGPRTYLGLR